MITQKRLKEELTYSVSTGEFRFKRTRRSMPKGKLVGHLNKENGYIDIGFDGKVYRAHRLAWLYCFGYMPEAIDHHNHDRQDNRLSNLFESSYAENNKNQGMRKDNLSDFTGVNWHKSSGKWCAQIMVNKKKRWLGTYELKSDAIKARMEANILYGFHENHGIKL